jgi:hypothetical protein
VEIDRRVARRYESIDEDARLWQPGKGDLVRLRTWDIFERSSPGQAGCSTLAVARERTPRISPPGATR